MCKQLSYVDEAIDYLKNGFTMPNRAYFPRDIEEENTRMKIAEENINTLAIIMEHGDREGHFISHDRQIKIQFSRDKAPVFFQNAEQITYSANDFKKQKKLLNMIYSAMSVQTLTGRDFDFCYSFHDAGKNKKYLLGNNKILKDSVAIFSCVQSEKRSFFVCSKIYYQKVFLGEHPCLPRQVKYPLFNGHMAHAAIVRGVLLTDDLEIAGFNHSVQKFEWQKLYPWGSFFAPGNDLSRVDWEPLRGKRIFYILKQHSGMSRKKMFQKAHDILDILFPEDPKKQIAGEFYFVVFEPLTDVCNGTTDKDWLPFHMTVEDFRREYSSIAEPSNFSTPITMKNLFLNLRKPPNEKKQAIIPALIPAQAVTLFYGCQNTMLTKFMVSMAFFISQGKSFVDAWPHATPQKCLYIHNNETNLNFTEGLMDALSCAFPKLQKAEVEEIQKTITGVHPQATLLNHEIKSFPMNCSDSPIHPDPSDPIAWQNFFWTSLPVNPFDKDFIAWIDFIRYAISKRSTVELIVLDIPDILQIVSGSPMFLDGFRRFLNELRCNGYSIFLTGSPTWGARKEVLNLEIDQIFRFDRKGDYSSGGVFEVYVERNDVSEGKCLSIKNCFSYGPSTANGPKRWALITENISTEEKIKILKKNKNRTIREIAVSTGWSVPLIKKLRRMGNLAKAVPSRSPKGRNRKKKSLYAPLSEDKI